MIAIADSGKRDVFGLLSAVLIVTLAIWVEPSAEKRALLALLGALVLFWPHSSSAGFERARARLLGALALVSHVTLHPREAAETSAESVPGSGPERDGEPRRAIPPH